MESLIIDSAKIMSKGQITIPKDIRDRLGLDMGDRVTLICENDRVVMINSAVYAMQLMQKQMSGAAQDAGLTSDDDVIAAVAELRSETDE